MYDDIEFIINGQNMMKSGFAFFLLFWMRRIGVVLAAAILLSHAMTAQVAAFEPTQCAAPRYGSNLNCTAGDVLINTVKVVGDIPPSCVGGQTLPLDLDVTLHFGQPNRYNIGIFVSSDGKSPQFLQASGGASACSVAVLPNTSPFLSLDGGNCGDGNGSINGGTGNGTFRMSNVPVPCTTDGSGNATLYIPYLVAWDQSSNYGACQDNTYPVPGAPSKCNTGTVSFPAGPGIIVLPAISLTDGVTTVRSGDTLTYKAVISNTTASTLSGAIFTSPAVANLSISSVSCTAANGAVCPTSPAVPSMQGAGIALPTMPNDSSLTFTIIGTYTGQPTGPATLTNTANVTVSNRTNSASDTDTVMVAPLVTKSFSPNVIAIGGVSTLTITLSNPTATVDITGAGFTDNYPANMRNTGTPSLVNSCGGTTTASANGTSLTLSGATIPRGSSCTVSVQVTATTAGINNTGTVVSGNAAGGTAATATLLVPSAAPGSFNAFESSTAAGAIAGVIKTKVSGSPFSLDVVAINGGAQANAFANAVKVELLGNTTPGIGLNSNNCPVTYAVLQTISPDPLITNGRSTVNFAAVSDAWKDVRVRISYPGSSPPVTSCSTDNFAIRPHAFANITVVDQDWQTAYTTIGTPRTLYNTAPTGGNVHKAGQPFTIIATAVNSAAGTTSNYSGTPSASLTTCLLPAAPSSCVLGTLNLGTWSSSSGVMRTTTATYSEAGAFTMNLVDTSFANVDAADSSPAERYIQSASVSLGRFVPSHFSVTASNTPKLKTFCPSGSFTYIGQNFGYAMAPRALITAQNAVDTITRNYSGALWRPVPAFAYNSASGTLNTGLTTLPIVASNNDGTGSQSVNDGDLLAYVRNPTAPQTPFNADISLTLSVTDPSEAGVSGNGTINTLVPAQFNGTGSGIAFDSGNAFRYGRLKLGNAFGSEKLDLPVPIEAQYWNGVAFITNIDDSCTTLDKANVVLGNYSGGVSNIQSQFANLGKLSGGKASLKLTSPLTAGGADLTIKLGSDSGDDQSCPSKIGSTTGANLGYLQSQWCGSDFSRDPRARVRFGVYKNPTETIYMREMY